jgi:hypothetical protein
MPMVQKKISERHERTDHFVIADEDPMTVTDVAYWGKRFLPDTMNVQYHSRTICGPWSIYQLFISGQILNKDGKPGKQRGYCQYSPTKLADMPKWAQDIVSAECTDLQPRHIA